MTTLDDVVASKGPDMINSAFPILATHDLPRMLAFYRDRLGGVETYRFADPADLDGGPVFVSLDLGTSHLGLGSDPTLAGSVPSARFTLWIYVEDCDTVVDALRDVTTVVSEPTDQPWGERVASVLDPDGKLLTLGQAAR